MQKQVLDYRFDFIKENYIYKDGFIFSKKTNRMLRGSYDKYGYLSVSVKKTKIKYHRIVWFLHKNWLPLYPYSIDHINRKRDDNRIENLRVVNQRIQCLNNGRINKDTLQNGVYLDKTKGLLARYAVNCRGHIKRFRKLEDAVKYRKEIFWRQMKALQVP